MKKIALAISLALSVGCGSGGGNPTAPTAQPPPLIPIDPPTQPMPIDPPVQPIPAPMPPLPTPDPVPDPAPDPIPDPPPTNGVATLNWTPPTTNVDGSVLVDLAGYTIYYGTTSGIYDIPVSLSNPGLSSFVIEGLTVGTTYYFVITAHDYSGNESEYSNETFKVIL